MKRFSAGALGCLLATTLWLPAGLSASPNTHEADLNSTLSQHAARTTTITEEFHYQLKYPAGFTLLYNGHRGSKIEPCGCRALNLGGIDKEAAMIQEIRRQQPNALLVDTGGFFREFTDPAMRLQTWHLMDALHQLDVQAVNVGFPDLRQGRAALEAFQRQFSLPFISANIVDEQTGQPVFNPYKSFEVPLEGRSFRVGVVGVTAANRDASRGGTGGGESDGATTATAAAHANAARWMIAETNGRLPQVPTWHHEVGGAGPAAAAGGNNPALEFAIKGGQIYASGNERPYRVEDPTAAARTIGDELRPKSDYLVLLAFVSFDTALKMAADLPQYDLIIAADYVDHTEPTRPVTSGPLVLGGEYDGKYLGLVEVPTAAEGHGEEAVDRLPVLQSIKPLPEYHRFLDAFTSDTASLPVEEPQAQAQVHEKLYAGATSCRTCHIEAYNQWKTHKHSIAMKTLVDKNMQYNPDCLRCHTVAYRQPGGFTDLRVTSYLANVQCEVCHGPGEKHVKEMRAAEAAKREGKPPAPPQEKLRMEWDQNFCMQCHNPQNDPQFHFAEDILRVRHKNPAAARVRPTTVSLEM